MVLKKSNISRGDEICITSMCLMRGERVDRTVSRHGENQSLKMWWGDRCSRSDRMRDNRLARLVTTH